MNSWYVSVFSDCVESGQRANLSSSAWVFLSFFKFENQHLNNITYKTI